jgi:putative acetyltransferase
MTGVAIRRARPEDCAGICAAHVASIRGLCAGDYTPEQIESWCVGKTPGLYAPLLERLIWYIAEERGEIGGFGALDPAVAEVRGLYLAPAFAGRGVGVALMERLLADARSAGAQRVIVKATVTAERFYRRCGFVETGRGTHLSRGGVELPCVMMELSLK